MQATKTAALELGRRGGWAVALHPGTCNTNLSAPFQKGVPEGKLFPVERGATQLLDVIDGLAAEDNGGFFAWGANSCFCDSCLFFFLPMSAFVCVRWVEDRMVMRAVAFRQRQPVASERLANDAAAEAAGEVYCGAERRFV